MESQPQLPSYWQLAETRITLAYVDNSNQQAFIVRHQNELKIFKFGKAHTMETVLTTKVTPHSALGHDHVLFQRTPSKMYDILHFSSTGLTKFRYGGPRAGYVPAAYLTKFSASEGWTVDHSSSLVMHDFDRDGFDELVFIGPSGLNAVSVGSDARSIEHVLNSQEFSVDNRHFKAFAIMDIHEDLHFISVTDSAIIRFGIQLVSNDPVKNTDVSEDENYVEDAVDAISLLPSATGFLATLPLGDQLDVSSILYPRNPLLGTLDFSIPIIKFQNLPGIPIAQSIQFKEYRSADVLGSGWHLPVDCIWIDRRGSVFSIDHNYYLIKDGSLSDLKPMLRSESPDYVSFTLEGSEDVGIKFFKLLNKWEITTKYETLTYGSLNNVDWVQWEPGSDDWPLTAGTVSVEKIKPSIWFLSMRKDHSGNFLKYVYEPEYGSLASGQHYVQKLNLLKISNNHGDFVRFTYSKLYNTKLMTRSLGKTANLIQDVEFKYKLIQSTPRLVSVNQLGSAVLRFNYEGAHGELTEIHYPNGLVSKFSYSQFAFPVALASNRFSFFSNALITYGPSYTIISGKTELGQVRIMARDTVGSKTTEMSQLSFPYLGKEAVVGYEVHTTDHFFFVLLTHENHKELCLFRRLSQGWSSDSTYMKLSKGTILMVGKAFVLIRDNARLAVLQLNENRWDIKPVLNNLDDSTLVKAFSYAYVVYNDSELRIGFQNIDGTWISKILPIKADIVRSSLSILNRFDTDKDTLKNLEKLFTGAVLQIHHNAIVVRTLTMQGKQLYSNLHLYVINEKYDLINQETITVLVEDLDSYLLELPPVQNNFFKVGYKEVNGKFKVVVKSHTGSIMDEIDKIKLKVEEEIRQHPGVSTEEVEKYRRETRVKLEGELQQIYRNVTAGIPFAIDPSKFSVFVNSDHIVAVSTKVKFNGVRWSQETIPHAELSLANFTLKLDDSMTLSKSGKNETYKLFKLDKLMWDLGTIQGDDIHLSYPTFIGVQKPKAESKLLTFENGKIQTLPKGEVLNKISNSLVIVSTTEDSKSVIMRSVKALVDSYQAVITKQELFYDEHTVKTTEFVYDPKHARLYSDGLMFVKSKIVPGGESSLGWYEEDFNLGLMSNSTRTVYNSQGIAVKTVADSTKVESEKFDDEDTSLRDSTGGREIVDFRPFRFSHQMVSYYGFEPYEVNRIGAVDGKWMFDGQFVRQEDSNHFLRLPKGASISGRFKPKLNGFSYVFSCWIRANQTAVFPDSVILTVLRSDGNVIESINGKVKRNIGEWNYVEALYQHKVNPNAISFQLEIKNADRHSLDVDHVRFTPLQLNFSAKILDHSGNTRAVLTNSGTLQQTVLDLFGNVIAKVSETGNVSFFASVSKNTARRKNKHLLSRIEMHPTLAEIDFFIVKNKYVKSFKYQPDIFGLRFLFRFSETGNIILKIKSFRLELYQNKNHTAFRVGDNKTQTISSEGECLILLTESHSALWIDGHLAFEEQCHPSEQSRSAVDIETINNASLTELIFMYEPTVKIFYSNKLGLTIQEIVLTSHDTINCRQIVYDKVDRPVLKTKWIEMKRNGHMLFDYNPNLITNEDRILQDWKLEGLASSHNVDCEGYPYTWVSYRNDPLEVKSAEGLPGKPFSITGQYSVKFGSNPNIAFLKVLFPLSKGFRHSYEINSGGSIKVTVTDKRENKVAELVKVLNYDHRLTTFEYDEQNRLLRVLPPVYHREMNTFSKTTIFETKNLTSVEENLRKLWGKQYRYDANGRLIEKSTPDCGKEEYMYTQDGLLRFVIRSNSELAEHYVTYYTYGFDGNVIEKGLIDVPENQLNEYLENHTPLPNSSNFIVYDLGENELVPAYRNRVQKSSKRTAGVTVSEALLYNAQNQLTNQIFISSNNSLSIDYNYQNDKVSEIHYPFFTGDDQLLKISYEYTANGKIKTVRTGKHVIASLSYTPFDTVKEVHFEPNSRYTYKRTFSHNAPGFLSKITDKFLSETVDYIANSYSGQSFGDGTVSATTFNVSWHDFSNLELVKLKPAHLTSAETTLEQAELCLKSLQKLGYVDGKYRPLKTFYPSAEFQLPLICGGGSRANFFAAKLVVDGFPPIHGHRYDYENHQQLIKAKYFQSINESQQHPLTEATFSAAIKGLTAANSRAIWSALKTAGFIITDCSNSKVCHGLPGKSIFHSKITEQINRASLEMLLASVIKARKELRQSTFLATCKVWHQHDPASQVQICEAVWAELLANNFVGSRSDKSCNALNLEFKQTLKPHTRYLPDVVHILLDKFARVLSNSEADVQSYAIDANGNHLHFYTGFNRYRLEYVPNTNKIEKIHHLDLKTEALQEREYLMKHDFEGNVVRATHKGIKSIVYDRLLKRAKEIELTDGRKLSFQYNARGERIFKQVKNKNGSILSKKYYLRDLKGRCLVDHEIIYSPDSRINYIRDTAYIFVEDLMVGFIRNNQFYSVFTDHEGSIRLVIRNGEVVAAYDYLPYGSLLRKYLSDPEGDITYRYTGQEWDEETKLYNFHARLYDPEIGRFFQIDPKEQYSSPYIYAGNSPISLVDPDGEFAFLIPVALAIVGAYLGASAANNSFNPTKWKLAPTLYGAFLGAVVGAIAPAGISASFTFLTTTVGLSGALAGGVIATTSVTFAYISTASANKNWNPIEWDWASPGTWNSLFSGSLSGATLISGIGKVHAVTVTLSGTAKIAFISATVVSTVGVALYSGAEANNGTFKFWEWKWSSPETIWTVIAGASFGMSMAADLRNLQTDIRNKITEAKKLVQVLESGNKQAILSEVKTFALGSVELANRINAKLKFLAKRVRTYKGFALVAAASPKGTDWIDGVEEVLFEISKFESALQTLGKQFLQPKEPVDSGERLRRKRNIECCQLQTVDHWFMSDNANSLKSGVSSYFSLKNLFRKVANILKYFSKPKSTENTSSELVSQGKKQNKDRNYILNNCYKLQSPNETYSIHCFGWNARYEIYPNLSANKLLVDEDSFSRCMPINYNDKPSVVCDGVKSSLLFIPNDRGNVLDSINGLLLLVQIAPAAVSRIKRSFHSMLGMFSNKTNKVQQGEPNRNQISILKQKLDHFSVKFDAFKSDSRYYFMYNIWYDLNEDVEKYSKNINQGDFNELLSRTEALLEELRETIIVSSLSNNQIALDFLANKHIERAYSAKMFSNATAALNVECNLQNLLIKLEM
ncbi:uncharacterized protein LOC128742634 [Sabethes cyaneus]|uniref:uncharacterized protein LOC128742634 n=1 Tax=Sabethes cyaneus TaxID=53552 RepID=UPI00237E30B6|nr:uncharacterized protein LOC128742634 [Sabethes cyaneus]